MSKPHLEQTVFIIDDDTSMRNSVSRSLMSRGFAVATFESAEQFLESYEGRRPGCIVLDYGLPGMDGLELQTRLIEMQVKTPIVFITGHGGVPESVKATRAGAVDFLEKPFEPETLADCVRKAFEQDLQCHISSQGHQEALAKISNLTAREREVFDVMIAKPELSSSKGVALELGISPRTVDKHRAQILLKTQSRSVAELIGRYAEVVLEI